MAFVSRCYLIKLGATEARPALMTSAGRAVTEICPGGIVIGSVTLGAEVTQKDTATSRSGWTKSSHSANGASCVEVKFARGVVLVRDSKDKRSDQPLVSVSAHAWHLLLDAIR